MPTVEELSKQLEEANKEREALKSEKALWEKEKLDAKNSKKSDEGKDSQITEEGEEELRDKVRKAKESKALETARQRSIEAALKFNIQLPTWVKENAELLPESVQDIIEASDKQNYDSATDKVSALKSQLIQEFFMVQANLDLLTASQKNTVAEYLNLTKNSREQKAESIYESIFEPTLEQLRRVKKAEELALSREGRISGGKAENAYRDRLKKLSEDHYLRRGA